MNRIASLYLLIVFSLTTQISYSQVANSDTLLKKEYLEEMSVPWEIMKEAIKEQYKGQYKDSLKHQLKQTQKYFEKGLNQLVCSDQIDPDIFNSINNNILTTTVRFEGESETNDIVINVERKTPNIYIIINGVVKSGNVEIEIYDPTEKKQGGFSIINDKGDEKEIVNGSISKKINTPKIGKWKVKVKSNKAYGSIFITFQKL
jgi:hypothetical protein